MTLKNLFFLVVEGNRRFIGAEDTERSPATKSGTGQGRFRGGENGSRLLLFGYLETRRVSVRELLWTTGGGGGKGWESR